MTQISGSQRASETLERSSVMSKLFSYHTNTFSLLSGQVGTGHKARECAKSNLNVEANMRSSWFFIKPDINKSEM